MRWLVVLVLSLWVSCARPSGPDEENEPQTGQDSGLPANGGSTDDGGVTSCQSAEDCGGNSTCCTSIGGGLCQPKSMPCDGLVLCASSKECPPHDPVCCPQGFCGGCD